MGSCVDRGPPAGAGVHAPARVFKDSASFVTPEVRTLENLAPSAGIEPATRGLGNHCSSPLSYEGRWQVSAETKRRARVISAG